MKRHRITLTGPVFCAAHSGLHGGRFEALHGHTFTTRLHLEGDLDGAGMVADFTAVKAALAAAVQPLRRRTLMPGRAPAPVRHRRIGEEIEFSDGYRRFVLPAADVVVLPLANTTTELIARHLLDQLHPLPTGVAGAELVLGESPTAQASASIGGRRG
ncbi:6-pyruvoyl trahydropterin synthase family protein [Nocardiopsis composta]|uniref:6-carboxy-5,6,7,8-tetrahydropterin synthase n=1 Tax=Nocardiopsis composta TaxID=157465 RepID=A0A7W8QRK2_9ACTN|nr:6-carboxytetrahydropterin synthase [Nocardiopsis composta]MBB5435184.1 6-pyruvoyltetrahydropterin/6-carboxytetrahydropterin synthase [Nocardiopsis composta]